MPSWKDEARTRLGEKSAGASLKLVSGENCVRVLPNKKDLLPTGQLSPKGVLNKPYIEFKTHRDVGPDKAFLACGHDVEGNGECWLCDKMLPQLEASDNHAKRAMAYDIRSREQFVVIASKFDPDTNKFSVPQPWWVSTGSGIPGKQGQSLAVRIFSKLASSKKDYVDPLKGYNLNITKTGEGLKTRYPEIEGDEAPSRVPAEVLKKVPALEEVVMKYDEEEQKSAFYGRPRRDEEGGGGKRSAREETDTAEETFTEEEEPVAEADETIEELPAEEEIVEEEGQEPEPPGEEEPEILEEFEAEPEPEAEFEAEEEPEPEPAPPPRRAPAARPAPKPVAVAPKPAAKPAARPAPPAPKPAPRPALRRK